MRESSVFAWPLAMTSLSVNLNKIALLRNSRGGSEPDVIAAARCVVAAGAQGITVHPRPDQRHIRADDVRDLARLLRKWPGVELNIEGNPFAPAQEGYPGLLELVRAVRPQQCTLVPDADNQLTSDHGFDLPKESMRLASVVAALRELGTRVSVFVDAGIESFDAAAGVGIDRIEIYTGPYAQAHQLGSPARALEDCVRCARAARRAGLGVNAGHDLDQENLAMFLMAVPGVLEVSIGHALVGAALYAGLDTTVRAYLSTIRSVTNRSSNENSVA